MDGSSYPLVDDGRSLLVVLLTAIYATWLLAGIVDYLCHRGTDIAGTSGLTESWLHVAQFSALGVALLLATLLIITPLAFALMLAAVFAHSVLSYVDVAYTQPRRLISPLEQQAHGFLDVLPLIATCLVAVLNWHELSGGPWTVQWKESPARTGPTALLLGSFFLLAGVPVFEELWRTWTRRRAARRSLSSS